MSGRCGSFGFGSREPDCILVGEEDGREKSIVWCELFYRKVLF